MKRGPESSFSPPQFSELVKFSLSYSDDSVDYGLVSLFGKVIKGVFISLLADNIYTHNELDDLADDIIEVGTQILASNPAIYRKRGIKNQPRSLNCFSGSPNTAHVFSPQKNSKFLFLKKAIFSFLIQWTMNHNFRWATHCETGEPGCAAMDAPSSWYERLSINYVSLYGAPNNSLLLTYGGRGVSRKSRNPSKFRAF